jgi:Protein of unknown function (DUF2971)
MYKKAEDFKIRLYYMTTLETLEECILPDLRIRVSTFDSVNDPFELLGARQTGRNRRRVFADLYKHWVGTLGFVSFTDNWKSPLMWGHYAKNHTGVCLGIDVPSELVWQINYQKERLNALLYRPFSEVIFDENLLKQIVTTKFDDWAYEREWRYMQKLAAKDPDTGLYFEEFSPDFELREIITGARCSRKLKDIRKQVFGNTGEIKVFQARAAFGTFSMVRQRLHDTLTIAPLHQVKGLEPQNTERKVKTHNKALQLVSASPPLDN